ncbi:MAG: succinyl-diaminopimelate desuccinylase [Gammaproteobacteria bacterium]|nr:succinyl-diaminopimelate desuccinylase [Gammaproteobacteria bacterium]
MGDLLELTKELIRKPSITPNDAGCMDLIILRLKKLGFSIELFPAGAAQNLWARFGTQKPLVCFLGHTDVVPTGPIDKWTSPPFSPEIRDGYLYGRGACDMKAGVAAIIVAIENYVRNNPTSNGSIAVLLSSSEEGDSSIGTPVVVAALEKRHEKIDYCITAEPSSDKCLGDIIRNGRRGSLNAKLIIYGKQGHVAFPHNADNAIHKSLAVLHELVIKKWDNGHTNFPETKLQISNIQAGTGANNVIPGELQCEFNFRFSPSVTVDELKKCVAKILEQHKLNYKIDWQLSGEPFFTAPGKLTQTAIQVIQDELGITPELSTGGGTSDARFIAPTGAQVIELGVSNQTAHQIDERVKVDDLEKLVLVYEKILEQLL